MKIEVRVKAGVKKAGIEKISEGMLVVKVKEPAKEGKANEAVIEALAKHFDVPKRAVIILHGHTSRNKLIEIARLN